MLIPEFGQKCFKPKACELQSIGRVRCAAPLSDVVCAEYQPVDNFFDILSIKKIKLKKFLGIFLDSLEMVRCSAVLTQSGAEP
jgi:hypothetical protein